MVSVFAEQKLEWSPLGTIPERRAISVLAPLVGTGNISAVNGSSGDLLIVQLKGETGQTSARLATLRTLGLRGLNSASLRNTSDPTIWGQIRAVRDLIGVIELDEVKWKAAVVDARDPRVTYNRIPYGSGTRPGAVVHNTLGDYFVFESTRSSLLVNWTTALSAAECLDEFDSAFEGLQARPADVSVIALASGGSSDEVADLEEAVGDDAVDDSLDVIDLPTAEAIRLIRSGVEGLVSMRLSIAGVDLIWQEPFVRFLVDDEALAEVGLFSHDLSFVQPARKFARATANRGFFNGRDFEVMVRVHGNPRRLRF